MTGLLASVSRPLAALVEYRGQLHKQRKSRALRYSKSEPLWLSSLSVLVQPHVHLLPDSLQLVTDLSSCSFALQLCLFPHVHEPEGFVALPQPFTRWLGAIIFACGASVRVGGRIARMVLFHGKVTCSPARCPWGSRSRTHKAAGAGMAAAGQLLMSPW